MELNIIKLVDKGNTLSTRDLGREIRTEISNYLDNGLFVRLELEGVELFSSGFADELFGKLSATYKPELLRANLKVIYPTNEKAAVLLRSLIVKAVVDRRSRPKEESQH